MTLNGVTSNKINVALPVDAAPYLRVVRSGDVWSFAWSADGVAWTTAGSFTQGLDVTAVGPFAGGLSSPYLARVDYFENPPPRSPTRTARSPSRRTRAPVAQDDALSATAGTPLTFNVASLLWPTTATPTATRSVSSASPSRRTARWSTTATAR